MSAASRLPWCARSHPKSWLERSRTRERDDRIGAEGRRDGERATPIAAFRIRAMRGLARGARVEHLHGRVRPDVEHHQARLRDVVDLDLRLVACSQQSPLARELRGKVSTFRDLTQSLNRPGSVDDAAHQRSVDGLHHKVASGQRLALADVPDEIRSVDRQEIWRKAYYPSRLSPKPCLAHRSWRRGRASVRTSVGGRGRIGSGDGRRRRGGKSAKAREASRLRARPRRPTS